MRIGEVPLSSHTYIVVKDNVVSPSVWFTACEACCAMNMSQTYQSIVRSPPTTIVLRCNRFRF